MKKQLFHGSDHIIETPIYGVGKKHNDYGQGFYCTEDIALVYMSTENSVNRSLKTRSLLTKFGTCNITATGAVTI